MTLSAYPCGDVPPGEHVCLHACPHLAACPRYEQVDVSRLAGCALVVLAVLLVAAALSVVIP